MKLDASDIQELVPVIREVVRAVLDELQADRNTSGGQSETIGLTERDAAKALGVAYHVLRDARLQGRLAVQPTRLGRKLVYSREALRELLSSRSELSKG